MVKKSILLCVLLGTLLADDNSYPDAVASFNAKEYTKAFPAILEAAQKGNKEAQGQMAYMYENGLGTNVDYKQALYWYKQASPSPAETAMDAKAGKNIAFDEQVVADAGRNNPQEIEKLHKSYLTPTKEMNEILEGRSNFFGLQPYQDNYLLPISYLSDKPRRVYAAVSPNNPVAKGYTYDNNTEVQFQISLKKEIFYDLLGFGESLNAAYTQRVFWQFYSPSGPFRETNYMPEIFLTVPTPQDIAQEYGLKAVKTGFIHQSNGQEGYRSRSWNRVYAAGIWDFGNLLLNTQAWYRLPEDKKSEAYYNGTLPLGDDVNKAGDDNPDIEKYMGYGSIEAKYLYGQSEFGLLFRNNLRTSGNKGAIELNYSYPAFGSKNTFWYAKFFNGYGNSLIDYDQSVTNTSFGVSFSR